MTAPKLIDVRTTATVNPDDVFKCLTITDAIKLLMNRFDLGAIGSEIAHQVLASPGSPRQTTTFLHAYFNKLGPVRAEDFFNDCAPHWLDRVLPGRVKQEEATNVFGPKMFEGSVEGEHNGLRWRLLSTLADFDTAQKEAKRYEGWRLPTVTEVLSTGLPIKDIVGFTGYLKWGWLDSDRASISGEVREAGAVPMYCPASGGPASLCVGTRKGTGVLVLVKPVK